MHHSTHTHERALSPPPVLSLCFLPASLYELHVHTLSTSVDGLLHTLDTRRKFDMAHNMRFRRLSAAEEEELASRGANGGDEVEQGDGGAAESEFSRRLASGDVEAAILFDNHFANTLQAQYALLIHPLDGASRLSSLSSPLSPSAGGAPSCTDGLTPLELLYLLRLCAYDNTKMEENKSLPTAALASLSRPSSTTLNSTPLYHLDASDEELANCLLEDFAD